MDQPILKNRQLEKIRTLDSPFFKSKVIDITFEASGRKDALEDAIDLICYKAENAARYGINVIVLSDRKITKDRAPIPSLLATGAVHHHLIQKRAKG